MNGEVDELFFSVPGTVLLVDDGAVNVFECGNAETADPDAARVPPDGFTVEVPSDGETTATDITLGFEPPLLSEGEVIVLFVGDDADLIRAVEAALGSQFAGQLVSK